MRKTGLDKRRKQRAAQAMLEFTFSMVIAVLLLIGMIQAAVWSGKDMAERRQAHERYLTTDVVGWEQTNPMFFTSSPVSAAVSSNIFGNYLAE